ncbi:transposase, partial [Pasteurella multocida]|uniref:transposase n=1 Tax=Pasteurella multocida TaxID=747 RepID=UPI00352A7CED
MASKSNDDPSLSHTRWNCKYHIVFIPKYRRKAIYGKLRVEFLGERLLCKYSKFKYENCRGIYPKSG